MVLWRTAPLSLILAASCLACSPWETTHDEPAAPAVPADVFERERASSVTTDPGSTGGVSWADVDGDGDIDLFVTNGYDVSAAASEPQINRLYENRGDGLLVRNDASELVRIEGFSSGSTWGDMDNDGDLDVFVANQRDQDNFLFRNEGGGRFTLVDESLPSREGGHSYGASWVDVDSDGLIDLFVANGGLSHRGRNFLYRNEGDGRFSRVVEGELVTEEGSTCGASWADYDGDGDQDVFVADLRRGQSGEGGLFRNDGGWHFTKLDDSELPAGPGPFAAASWGDVDRDGDLDLYLAALYGQANVLLLNDGAGGFERVEDGPAVLDGGHSYAAGWADRDADGDLDLLVGNWGAAAVLYCNDGTGRLQRCHAAEIGERISYAANLAWADFDEDGDVDPVIGNWPNRPGKGEPNELYLNVSDQGHWLEIDLIGTASNRSAIGARVVAEARFAGASWRVVRHVSAHNGWRSQDSLRQHFGLGDAEIVDQLVIHWPSGRTTRLEGVAVDQRLTIKED